MPTSIDRTTVIPTRVTVVPADPVPPSGAARAGAVHRAGGDAARRGPGARPPSRRRWPSASPPSGRSVRRQPLPDQTAQNGRTGPGGFPGFPGGQNGFPGGQNGLPGGQLPGQQNGQGTQGGPVPGWQQGAQGPQSPGGQGWGSVRGFWRHQGQGSTGSQGPMPGQLPVLPQTPGGQGTQGGAAGGQGTQNTQGSQTGQTT